jgi:hypothetical protein
VQLSGKEYVYNLEGLRFEPMFPHFFMINYLYGAGGGGPTWRRADGRGRANHHGDGTELIMYYIYEYKYTKYLIEHK